MLVCVYGAGRIEDAQKSGEQGAAAEEEEEEGYALARPPTRPPSPPPLNPNPPKKNLTHLRYVHQVDDREVLDRLRDGGEHLVHLLGGLWGCCWGFVGFCGVLWGCVGGEGACLSMFWGLIVGYCRVVRKEREGGRERAAVRSALHAQPPPRPRACMHVASQSWPKRSTTTRSSSARMAWSTAYPLRRWVSR